MSKKTPFRKVSCYCFPKNKPKIFFSSYSALNLLNNLYKPHSLLAKIAIGYINTRVFKLLMIVFYKKDIDVPAMISDSRKFTIIKGSNDQRLKYISSFVQDKEALFMKYCMVESKAKQDIIREVRLLKYYEQKFSNLGFDFPRVKSLVIDEKYCRMEVSSVLDNNTQPFADCDVLSFEEVFDVCSRFKKVSTKKYSYNRSIVHYVFNQAYKKLDNEFLTEIQEKYTNNTIELSFCHGDFTPWNVKKYKEVIGIIDLEMSRIKFPAYFDFVHFWYSQRVLLDRHSHEFLINNIQNLILSADSSKRDELSLVCSFYFCLLFLRGKFTYEHLDLILEEIRDLYFFEGNSDENSKRI